MKRNEQRHSLLPICRGDMNSRGWSELDFLLVTGDAYVDHPTFANGLIARWMEHLGWRIGVVAQPDWKKGPSSIEGMGRPRLGVLVSAGNLDSMLNKLTAARHKRRFDEYSPGGITGQRPDRATLVYCNMVRQTWGDIPLFIGGIEASMRRFAHYDYWSDQVRRSVLVDSRADVLIFGMGELQLAALSQQLAEGRKPEEFDAVAGTCIMGHQVPSGAIVIPSYEEVSSDKKAYAEAFRLQYLEQDPVRGKTVVQPTGDRLLIQYSPMRPMSTAELDLVNELPYTRMPHWRYQQQGGVPASREVQFSITSTRGCFGSCSFCAIHAHQGRIVQARSHESMLREARAMTFHKDFKGQISDVGGPTGNFRGPSCAHQAEKGCCRHRQCLHPAPCPQLETDHSDAISLLRKLREVPGVKRVFIRSGLRYDYILADPKGEQYVEELCRHHVSGQLRVAPEHASARVLDLMGKPSIACYVQFKKLFEKTTRCVGKEQYVLPYLISSHPGSTLHDAIELAEFLRDQKFTPEQVQDFIPTPGSLATCMYHTGINPLTGEAVHVPKGDREKSMQRALLQYKRPENRHLVERALKTAGRNDLIGYGPQCLIRPVSCKAGSSRPLPTGKGKKR